MAMRRPSARHWRAEPRHFLRSRSILGCYAVKSIRRLNAPLNRTVSGLDARVTSPNGRFAPLNLLEFAAVHESVVGRYCCKSLKSRSDIFSPEDKAERDRRLMWPQAYY